MVGTEVAAWRLQWPGRNLQECWIARDAETAARLQDEQVETPVFTLDEIGRLEHTAERREYPQQAAATIEMGSMPDNEGLSKGRLPDESDDFFRANAVSLRERQQSQRPR